MLVIIKKHNTLRYLLILAIAAVSLSYSTNATGQGPFDIIGEGWEHIGTRKINKKVDRAEIPVTIADGNYKKIILIAENKPIILKQCTIQFMDNTKQIVNMREKLEAEDAAPEIDLTGGGQHVIKKVWITYEAKSKKGKVRLYGMR